MNDESSSHQHLGDLPVLLMFRFFAGRADFRHDNECCPSSQTLVTIPLQPRTAIRRG